MTKEQLIKKIDDYTAGKCLFFELEEVIDAYTLELQPPTIIVGNGVCESCKTETATVCDKCLNHYANEAANAAYNSR